jgi:DNA-binding Lrp family transcriptional regulator
MINRKVSAPSNNLTMKPKPRPSMYTGFRTPPIMRGGDRATVEAFEQAVAAIPHVRQAQRLFGEPGYLLRVITADLPAFPGGLGNRLATLPGVQRLSSTRVTKSVVENRPLPLYQNRRPPKGTG